VLFSRIILENNEKEPTLKEVLKIPLKHGYNSACIAVLLDISLILKN
jgi:hypothetical protein